MDLQNTNLVAETVICRSAYDSDLNWPHLFLLCLAVALILAALFGIWKFSKKVQLFPLKGRAPRFVLVQMIYFLLLCIIPLLVEGLIASEVNWTGKTTVYLSQVFLKALYATVRTWAYLAYIFRTLVIYANWRVSFDKLKSSVWKVLGNELNSLMVGNISHRLSLSYSFAHYSCSCLPSRSIGLVILPWIDTTKETLLCTWFCPLLPWRYVR